MGKRMRKTTESDPMAPNPGAGPLPAAELAAVATRIAADFPLVLEQTSLVLLDVDPGHLHAFWTLAPGALAEAGVAFPGGDAAPEAVLRLRRLHPDGGAEDLGTQPLAAGPRGDARFGLDPGDDAAAYQAEIGLRNAQGGWVLVARSNQARLPRPVGVPIPVWDGVEPVAPTEPAEPVLVTQSGPERWPESGPVSQPWPDSRSGPGRGARPGAGATTGPGSVPVPAPGTRPARWVMAVAAAGGISEDAEPGRTQGVWPMFGPWPRSNSASEPRSEPGSGSEHRTEPAPPWPGPAAPAAGDDAVQFPDYPWQPASRGDWIEPAWPLGTDVAATATPIPGGAEAGPYPEAGGGPWTPGPGQPQTQPEPTGPISSFALGRGPAGSTGPLVEAEVLVHVSGPPGTLVELYGRSLRVGPSGRSTLRLPVPDLALLEGLLAWSVPSGEGPAGH